MADLLPKLWPLKERVFLSFFLQEGPMKKRSSQEQMVSRLRKDEVREMPAKAPYRKPGIYEQTSNRRKIKYGGTDDCCARRLKTLESENAKL